MQGDVDNTIHINTHIEISTTKTRIYKRAERKWPEMNARKRMNANVTPTEAAK